ncbi:hypothetical protein NY2A_b729L [Paramecium bursaria Chlorella virus NY2A]|uniref:Uncharacterized protein b729L n=1 Tax=Paramecium bursaria Chlorella virus NY2A TaxID=46021 RepID=A7IXQ4_PBCVN|nr:hypothetical protein NY2A_b729L [Paramecium bursaria Chlorella virus NY2A]ABT15128.1 hypothetical protein NY2A_b729L [Paramecium bursaria Chlorella virus NY2A]
MCRNCKWGFWSEYLLQHIHGISERKLGKFQHLHGQFYREQFIRWEQHAHGIRNCTQYFGNIEHDHGIRCRKRLDDG